MDKNKQEKIHKVTLFRTRILIDVGTNHMRAFDEYWGGLKRKCYEIGEMTITKTLDTKQLIILGNVFEIEICGSRKKDVKCILDHIEHWLAEESKNPLYPMV